MIILDIEDINTMIDIGEKIRKLRKDKGINISDLAKIANLSTGLISQIERNLVVPSVTSLWKIAKGLEVSIGYFFDEEDKKDINPIIKKTDRKKIVTKNLNAVYELLTPDLNRKIEFLYITIEPGDATTTDLIAHEGEECGLIMKGKLLVRTEKKDYVLEEGDSIYLNSTIAHRYINIGDEPCESIWAMTPPSF